MRVLSACAHDVPHPPPSVFALWADPRTWPMWDPDVADVRFEGDASVGASGWMRPTSGPSSTFEVTEMDVDRLFTNVSRLPGAVLTFAHTVQPAGAGSRAAVTISVTGPWSGLWGLVLRKGFRDTASRNVSALRTHLDDA